MVIWDAQPDDLKSSSEKASSDKIVSLYQLVSLTDLEYKTSGRQ